MADIILIRTPTLLHAYRNAPDWQEQLKNQMAALVSFLHEHELLRIGALSTPDERAGLFTLCSSDLTEDGLKLFLRPINAFDKWLNANSNPAKPLSMRSLENGLKKVRAEHSTLQVSSKK